MLGGFPSPSSSGPGEAYFLVAPAELPRDPPAREEPPQREPLPQEPVAAYPLTKVVGRDGQTIERPLPCEELEAELEVLRTHAAALERELALTKSNPFSQAVASGEFAGATPEDLAWLEALLENVPVPLRTGEALWLLERKQANDWTAWGGVEEAMLSFFGRERLLSALGAEKFARVFE